MLRNVFTKDLWDRRKSTAWWVAGLVLLIAMVTSVYPTIRDSQAMKDFIETFPPELLAMFGIDPDTYLTGAGFLQAQMFSLMIPLIVIAFGVGAGAAVTAREEKVGTMDVLLSTPVTRSSIVLQKAASLTLVSGVIMAAVAMALLLMNVVVDLKLSVVGLVAACVGAWLLCLVAAGVTMVIGSFTGSPTIAMGAGAGLAIAAWFVNAFSTLYSWLEIPSKLSPFSWYLHGSPLLNGFSSGHLWLALVSVALVAGATVLFLRRNIATERTVLPDSAPRRAPKQVTPRSPRLLGSVFGKSIWDRRRSVWIWAIGLSMMSFLTFSAWPALAEDSQALQDLVDAFPKEVLALFGLTDPSSLATPEGFVSSRTYGSVGPIVVIVFAISAMASLVAKEESSGILDLVVSASQRRRALLAEKAYAVFILLGIIAAFLFVVALAGNAAWDMDMGLYGMFAANVGLGLLGMCFWGISIALWSLFGASGPAIGATAAIAVGAYFLNGLGVIVDALAPARWISPFYWYLGDTVPLAKGITWGYLALAVVAVAGTAIAIARFEHRDLAV
jgi:ABC-2 type transport system permease protein